MIKEVRLEKIRILASVLVIIIHVTNRYCWEFGNISDFSYGFSVLLNTLSKVAVPLFLMISGAVMAVKPYNKDKYLARIKHLVFCLVLWTLIYFILQNIFYNTTFTEAIKELIGYVFTPIRSHFWFMYVIIGIYIIQPFIAKMLTYMEEHEENLFLIFWILFSGGVYFIRVILLENIGISVKVSYPIPLINATTYLGYFIAGHIIYKRIQQRGRIFGKAKLLGVIIAGYVINFISTMIFSYAYNKNYNKMLANHSISTMIIALSLYILFLQDLKPTPIGKFRKRLIECNLGIYLIHILFLDGVLLKLVDLGKIPALIGVPVITVLLYFLSYVMVLLLKKIPFLGKYIT